MRRVAIYRDVLLQRSETFVKTQAESLERWVPTMVGCHRVEDVELANQVITLDRLASSAEVLAFKISHRSATLRRALSTTRPELMHAHFGPDGFRARWLAASLGIPLVVTFHGYDATRRTPRGAPLSFWQYWVGRRSLRRSETSFVAVSDFIRSRLIDAGFDPDHIVVRYIGVDTEKFRPSCRPASDRHSVLFVGRLDEKKGCDHLIRAFRSGQVPSHARLSIVGDGPLREDLQVLASSRANIEFLGWKPHDEVVSLMRSARCLVVPSVESRSGDTEGLPTVITEAMATGLPVVGFPTAGIPEAIVTGETGIVTKSRSDEELASSLARAFDDDTWSRWSNGARRRAVEVFDLRRCTAALEDVYDDVARV